MGNVASHCRAVEYYFAQYNKTMTVDKYTDEEYAAYFEGLLAAPCPVTPTLLTYTVTPGLYEYTTVCDCISQCLVLADNDWTKPETDTLFELCQRLDTRFITVADRLENRSVEVLPKHVSARAQPHYCVGSRNTTQDRS